MVNAGGIFDEECDARHPRPPARSIPVLGTNWYTRGFRYWQTRLFLSFFTAVGFISMSLFVWAAFLVAEEHLDGRLRIGAVAALTVVVAWSLFTGGRAIRRARSSMRSGEYMTLTAAHRPDRGRKDSSAAGLTLGATAYAGSSLSGVLLMIGALFGIGWVAALLANSLARYLGPDEFRAVQEMRSWFEEHPEIPDDQRPRQFRAGRKQ